MKFKNFHSYFWYGVKNGRLNVVSIVINGILLFVAICGIRNDIWSEIENISVNGQRYVILAVALILADIIWQIYSFANELAACFKKESYTEHEENNVDFKKLVKDSNEKVETCTNGSFSYNPNVCEKLVKHNDFKCVIREEAAEMVDNYVKGNFDCLFPFLSQHYNNAQAHEKLFTNDKKLCLSGKLNPESENVSFYKGCYYHSYLTNNIFLKSLSLSGTSVHIYPMHGCSNKKVEIPFEYFSNEIGVSTIAITKDGYLFVQKQGERADASSGLFVPSGSGSADWKDYTQNKKKDQTLDAIISYSTKRELAEETGFEKSNPDKIVSKNKIIGFFRWLNKGGKPEFVSLSKMTIEKHEIKTQKSEQQPLAESWCLQLFTRDKSIDKDKLKEFMKNLMENPDCSLPLYVNLKMLKEYIENNEEEFENFCKS